MHTLTAQDLIAVQDNQLITTSLKVAEAFGKLHKDVLRKIHSIDCSEEFSRAHFCARDQKVNTGKGGTRLTRVYEMTKDGFMFLVMGFTGKKAAQIKEAYINAFNEMAEKLYGKASEQNASAAGLDSLAPDHRAKAAITCWSALKSKFGCTYKKIDPDQFTDAVSLVARVPLEGEYLEGGAETAKFTDRDRNALHCLSQHLLALDRDFHRSVGPAVRALNTRLHHDMREHLFVAKRQCQMISNRLTAI